MDRIDHTVVSLTNVIQDQLHLLLQYHLLSAGRPAEPVLDLHDHHHRQRRKYAHIILDHRKARPSSSPHLGSRGNVLLRIRHCNCRHICRNLRCRQLHFDCLCLHLHLLLCIYMGKWLSNLPADGL
jgi:hypothetical protein